MPHCAGHQGSPTKGDGQGSVLMERMVWISDQCLDIYRIRAGRMASGKKGPGGGGQAARGECAVLGAESVLLLGWTGLCWGTASLSPSPHLPKPRNGPRGYQAKGADPPGPSDWG